MFEKIKQNFWKIISILGTVFSAVFYVLFKQKKQEERDNKLKELEKEVQMYKEQAAEMESESEKLLQQIENENKGRKENEEKINSVQKNNLDNFNTVINGLR